MPTIPPSRMTLPEELLLVALDPETGRFRSGSLLGFALPAAALLELHLRHRLTVEEGNMKVRDDAPTGRGYLDEVLRTVAARRKRISPTAWVGKIATTVKDPLGRVARDLEEMGLIRTEQEPVLGSFTRTVHPLRDTARRKRVLDRLHKTVTGSRRPDRRTAALAGLVGACRLNRVLYEPRLRRIVSERTRAIARSDTYGSRFRRMLEGVRAGMASGKSS